MLNKKLFTAPKYKLYVTGFMEVFLVVLNTSLVAQQVYSLVFFVGLAISLVWCYNVTNVAISSWRDKFIHSLGSATGSLAGLAVGDWLGSLSFIF